MNDSVNPSLLPSGFADLLYPDAHTESYAVERFMALFAKFGYERVKPPLLEFEDSLLAPGPGAALSLQTFRLMDPKSQRMMGLRADTTAQIARIANSRLAGDARPLRLSYAADVLRVNAGQIRTARQFMQVGCEMIGAKTPLGDAEIALMSVLALHEVGIQNITLDLTMPALIPHILDQASVAENTRAQIMSALSNRDRGALGALESEIIPLITALLDASGPADKAFKALEKINLNALALKDIQDLEAIYKSVKDGLNAYDVLAAITLDLIEHRGLSYEAGVSFTLYAKEVRGELGRGGRYSLQADAKDESATGFTLFMDSLLPALAPPAQKEIEHVSENANWDDIRAAQEAGKIVKRKL